MRTSAYLATLTAILLILGLSGCHSGGAVTTTTAAVPTSINLLPQPNASIEVGQTLTFTASATDSSNHNIANEPFEFASSNQAVVTVAANGIACAGIWDSLTNPQICTPGQTGTAVVTVTAQGVTSPSTVVYVHQHIDKILVSPVAAQPPPRSPLCFATTQTTLPAESFNYQANAFNGSTDITSTVGPFTWLAASTSVVTVNIASLTKPIPGLQPGQMQAVATVPGQTTIYASADDASSDPFTFTTCPVQSISEEVSTGTGNFLTVTTGSGSKTVNATVTDILGDQIVGIPITWCSSAPESVGVGGSGNCTTTASSTTAQFGSTISISPSAVGDATVTASCTPPNCNIGLFPTQPIYPSNVVNMVVISNGDGGSGSSEAAEFFVSSTECGTTLGCSSVIYPLPASTNQLGTPAVLPATPNGLTYNLTGSNIFIGTDFSLNNSQGLMIETPGTGVVRATGVTGRVLTISPDGTTAIVSDTINTPNQVYVVNTSTHASVPISITGATAASFSPDSLKAFIVANNTMVTPNTHTLYVYSKLDALQTIALPNPATNVAFWPDGAFAYLVGDQTPTGITVRRTCDGAVASNSNQPPVPQIFPLSSDPSAILPLPNSSETFMVAPPNVQLLNVDFDPKLTVIEGCTPTIDNTLGPSINLGQGVFSVSQVILSADGTKAYIISDQLSSIIVFDIVGLTTSSLALQGNVTPVQAALAPDGAVLAVAASDGLVHMINTVLGGDIAQVGFPQGICVDNAGNTYQGTVSITAASQSSTTTTYSDTYASGQSIQAGMTVTITGMTNSGNNGTFTITQVNAGSFTVFNPSGATASGQSGTGNFTCGPNLITAKP